MNLDKLIKRFRKSIDNELLHRQVELISNRVSVSDVTFIHHTYERQCGSSTVMRYLFLNDLLRGKTAVYMPYKAANEDELLYIVGKQFGRGLVTSSMSIIDKFIDSDKIIDVVYADNAKYDADSLLEFFNNTDNVDKFFAVKTGDWEQTEKYYYQ